MNIKYSIYPRPRELDFGEGSIPKLGKLQLRTNTSLNSAFEMRLDEIEDILASRADNSTVHTLTISLNESFDESAYTLDIRMDGIYLSAKSNVGLYYGLTTLYHLICQHESLPYLVIQDAPVGEFRGIVEGFYGIPYTMEKRKSLIQFGSYFKMNTYVFAPKDDPYHRERWWELYPENYILDLQDIASFSNAYACQFVWTIAPFKPGSNPITQDNKEEGVKYILAKFEQLYAIGIRQFGVLGDDVGTLPYDTVVEVMNDLNTWRLEKKDVKKLLFCPQGYTTQDWAFGDGTEANCIDSGFSQDIEIFFTGQSTCSVLNQDAIRAWKEYKLESGKAARRNPLFWMNWPVNDIDRTEYRRLFLGKGEVYSKGVTDFSGVLTNPMEEAEASKVALFATLDYAWNSLDFDADISWQDSFAYIDSGASEQLHEIAKHMSSIANGAKADAEESVELEKLHQDFFTTYQEKNEDFHPALENLLNYYKKIVQACEDYLEFSSNEALRKEIGPYVKTLHAKAQLASMLLLDIQSGKKAHNVEINQSEKDRKVQNLVYTKTAEFPSTTLIAEAGLKVIEPGILQLKEIHHLL